MRSFFILFYLIFTVYAFPYVFAGDNTHFIEVSHYPFSLPRTMNVSVLDHEGQPMPDVEVTLIGRDGGFFASPRLPLLKLDGQTNQNGKVVFHIPDEWFAGKITSAGIQARSSKYIRPASNGWSDPHHPRPGKPITVPEEVTLKFEKEKMLQLQVRNEAGQPVQGAKIERDPRQILPQESDSQGILLFGPLSNDPDPRYKGPSFRISHPDFQNEKVTVDRTDLEPPFKTVTLHKGSEVFGKIVDERGESVAGAKIYASGEKISTERETVTDEQGRYHLKGLFPSDQILIVAKEGKRLHVQALQHNQPGKEHDIVLQQAVPVRIRIVTESGQPLRGAKVEPKYTLKLGKFSYEYQMRFDETWTISDKKHFTDENGFWEWPDVPEIDKEIEFRFPFQRNVLPRPPQGKEYHIQKPVYHFRPQEEPYVVTAVLRDAIYSSFPALDFTTWKESKKLKVRVLDENLRPLAGALVEPCSGYGDSFGNFICVDEPFPTDENGVVTFDFSRTDISDIQDFWVKVSAKGCHAKEYYHLIGHETTAHTRTSYKTLPDEIEIVPVPEGKKLGFVRDEDGRPLEGASVTFSQGYPPASIVTILTDKNGKWILDTSDFQQDTFENPQMHVEKQGYLKSDVKLKAFPNFTMQTAKQVSFRVVDEKGNPLEGVQIIQSPEAQVSLSQGFTQWQTDTDGKLHVNASIKSKNNKVAFLLKKDTWTPQWQEVDLTGPTENILWTLKPAKDLRVKFSFEGKKDKPPIGQISAMIRSTSTKWSSQIFVKQWDEISRNEDGVFLLKDAPDCEAIYHFFVPNIGNNLDHGGIGYGHTITPNDEVVEVVKKRAPENKELKQSDRDYDRATPYGVIQYRILTQD